MFVPDERLLRPGERVLWSARPVSPIGRFLRGTARSLALVVIAWCVLGFVVKDVATALRHGDLVAEDQRQGMTFVVLFWIMAHGFFLFPVFQRRALLARAYFVTDRRFVELRLTRQGFEEERSIERTEVRRTVARPREDVTGLDVVLGLEDQEVLLRGVSGADWGRLRSALR